jgi:hypothetical protein
VSIYVNITNESVNYEYFQAEGLQLFHNNTAHPDTKQTIHSSNEPLKEDVPCCYGIPSGLYSIGSGAVESAIKQIGRRVQLSGAQWNRENVPQVLAQRQSLPEWVNWFPFAHKLSIIAHRKSDMLPFVTALDAAIAKT